MRTEKPKREEATSNWINAGTYILEPEVLSIIPQGERCSVERMVFPTLLKEGRPLYGYRSGAYWMDIGTPAKFLQAQADLLLGHLKKSIEPLGELFTDRVWVGEGTFITSGARVTGPAVLGARCSLEEGASITGPAVLGDDCHLGRGASLEGVIVLDGAEFGEKSRCTDSIIGKNAQIGANSVLEELVMIGDKARVGENNHLSDGAKLSAGETLPGAPAEGL